MKNYLGDSDTDVSDTIIRSGTSVPSGGGNVTRGIQQGMARAVAPFPWWGWLLVGYIVTRSPRGR